MDWEDGRRRERTRREDGGVPSGSAGGPMPVAAPAPGSGSAATPGFVSAAATAPVAGSAPLTAPAPVTASVPASAHVDADVPGAVRDRLREWLAHRTAWAEALDETFAHDVAARLERFALGGGKRVRPQFLWWGLRGCTRPGDARTRAALDVSAALELLQCCALIHDDVMDGDLVRRGEPSLHAAVAGQYAAVATGGGHRALGESAAILAGDLALVWADDMVGELDLPAPVAKEVRAVWAVMRTEMVAGQYLDMHGALTGTRSLARAVRAACLKSALYTVERPLQLGAVLAGADAKTTAALRAAGRCAGIAFQLHDDVRDLFGEPVDDGTGCGDPGGRPPGQDIRGGKPTYLIAVALARAESTGNAGAREVIARQVGHADLGADGLRAVREAVTATGARRIVTRRIDRLLDLARRHLSHASLHADGHDRLLHLMHAAAGRSWTTHDQGWPAHPADTAARPSVARHSERAAHPVDTAAGPSGTPPAERAPLPEGDALPDGAVALSPPGAARVSATRSATEEAS